MFDIRQFKSWAKKRGKEIKSILDADLSIESAQVKVGGQTIKLRFNVEKIAAWKLYVELNTRVTVQPLAGDQGLLREALTSFYSVFQITREILKEAGPEVALESESLGGYAMQVLNEVIRPLTAYWHPRLEEWESKCPEGMSRLEHESSWKESKKLRKEIEKVRKKLTQYCDCLGYIAGVTPLHREAESRRNKRGK